jgi:hypothetical protein
MKSAELQTSSLDEQNAAKRAGLAMTPESAKGHFVAAWAFRPFQKSEGA